MQRQQMASVPQNLGGARVNFFEVTRSLRQSACLETQVFEDNVHGVIVQDINLETIARSSRHFS